jgi:hypothetical protein
VDGRVLVYVPEGAKDPDREYILQVMGRGQRARGSYKGVIFYHDDEGMADSVAVRLKAI